MKDDLKLIIKEYIGADSYIDCSITLKAKESVTPWETNDFLWVGEYKGQQIIVSINRGDSGEFAKITKPAELNIANQIIDEINRVLRKLN